MKIFTNHGASLVCTIISDQKLRQVKWFPPKWAKVLPLHAKSVRWSPTSLNIRLLEHAKLKRISAGSLLDNEAVVMGVCCYLAQVNLGQVHPCMNWIGWTETEFDAPLTIHPSPSCQAH